MICVPYWWNRKASSLVALIKTVREDFPEFPSSDVSTAGSEQPHEKNYRANDAENYNKDIAFWYLLLRHEKDFSRLQLICEKPYLFYNRFVRFFIHHFCNKLSSLGIESYQICVEGLNNPNEFEGSLEHLKPSTWSKLLRRTPDRVKILAVRNDD